MKYIIILFLLVFCGCNSYPILTNDEIISENKKCEAAGMRTVMGYDPWTGLPAYVICLPKE